MLSSMPTSGEIRVLIRLWKETTSEKPCEAMVALWERFTDADVDALVDGLMIAEAPGMAEYLDMFQSDSAALTWAHMRAQMLDTPPDVRAFGTGGPATSRVWRWLTRARERVLAGKRAPRLPRQKRAEKPLKRRAKTAGRMVPAVKRRAKAASQTHTEERNGIPIVWSFSRRPS